MDEKDTKKVNINLLWTGGWDSTFQLLQLLLIHKCSVSPYYLIHEDRPSTGTEIKTMKDIKNYLIKKYPHTEKLLFPIRYYAVDDILPDEAITSAYNSILKKCHVGSQYEWLARFCKEKKIKEMQLSIQAHIKPDPTHFNIKPYLKNSVSGGQDVYIFDPKFKEMDEYGIFQYFSFPLMGLTKIQMNEVAKEKEWKKVMDMTWFCHDPTYDKKPCGICKPCIIAIDEDFAWRIPLGRRIISFYYRKLFWPSKAVIRSSLIKIGLYSNKNGTL
jgi:hypothetical protein